MQNRDFGLGHVRRGLSGKLLKLTSLFVMLAVVLVYVPSVANFYERWLADRIGRAHSVALVLDAAPSGMVPESLARQLLDSVGARLIVLKTGDTRRLLAASNMPPTVSREVDLRQPQGLKAVRDAFAILFSGKGVIRVVGPAPMGGQFVEVLLDERLCARPCWPFRATFSCCRSSSRRSPARWSICRLIGSSCFRCGGWPPV